MFKLMLTTPRDYVWAGCFFFVMAGIIAIEYLSEHCLASRVLVTNPVLLSDANTPMATTRDGKDGSILQDNPHGTLEGHTG